MLAADSESAAALATTLFERRPFELSLGFVDGAAPEVDLHRAAAAGYRMLERIMQRPPYIVTTAFSYGRPAARRALGVARRVGGRYLKI